MSRLDQTGFSSFGTIPYFFSSALYPFFLFPAFFSGTPYYHFQNVLLPSVRFRYRFTCRPGITLSRISRGSFPGRWFYPGDPARLMTKKPQQHSPRASSLKSAAAAAAASYTAYAHPSFDRTKTTLKTARLGQRSPVFFPVQ